MNHNWHALLDEFNEALIVVKDLLRPIARAQYPRMSRDTLEHLLEQKAMELFLELSQSTLRC
jgi:hypothetical protein